MVITELEHKVFRNTVVGGATKRVDNHIAIYTINNNGGHQDMEGADHFWHQYTHSIMGWLTTSGTNIPTVLWDGTLFVELPQSQLKCPLIRVGDLSFNI